MDSYFEDYYYKGESVAGNAEEKEIRDLRLALRERDFEKAKMTLQALIAS